MTPLAKEFSVPYPEDWRVYYPTQRQKNKYAEQHGLALTPYLVPDLDWMERTHNLSQIQPNTKIVLILRDPVKRFYTHWKWEVFISGKKCASTLSFLGSFNTYIDAALDIFPEGRMYTAVNSDPLRLGIYWKPLSYWIKCFGLNNLLVIDAENYFANRSQTLKEIYSFVGLQNFECPVSDHKVNENLLFLPPADEGSIQKLIDFYQPYNEKLWTLLERKFDWS